MSNYFILNNNWLFPIPTEGGGGNISVSNELGIVKDTVNSITFEGSDVQVTTDPLNSKGVIIRVPASLIASHFNTNDGATSAVVNSISAVNRNIANTLGDYSVGDWITPIKKPTVNLNTISYSTTSFFSILNNTSTTFTATIYNADGITEIASNTITITGNSDTTSNNIRIQVTEFQIDDTKYKAKISISFLLSNLLPSGGRFSIKLTHDNDTDGIFDKIQNNIFYDSNNITASISNPTFSINTPVTKFISGIEYYTNNTTFNVGIASIDNLNNKSYPDIQVQLNGSEIGTGSLSLQGSDLTDWTSDYNNMGASYSKTDWSLSTNNIFRQDSLKVSGNWIDWVNSTAQNSNTISMLVDTFVNNRSRIKEDFISESYRLNNVNTLWNSNESLLTYTDNTNGLQVINNQLVYPSSDFTVYNPNIGNQPDYTTCVSDRTFKSYFFYTNISKSNGIFTLSNHNITEADITNEDIKIEISLNSSDWFNCGSSFFGGILTNNSGCRIDSTAYNMSNNRLRFTLSTFFTSNATGSVLGGYWGIYFKITYKDTVRGKELYLGSIEISDWI